MLSRITAYPSTSTSNNQTTQATRSLNQLNIYPHNKHTLTPTQLQKSKMTRGGAQTTKVHYKGHTDDFLVFVDDVESYKKYLAEKEGEKTTPLAQVVSSFQVFTTDK